MERIPQELLNLIISFLPPTELKSCLLLSRRFQHATEQHSGRFKTFALTLQNTERFLLLYSGHRYNYLQRVTFQPTLSVPEMPRPEKFDPDTESYIYRESAESLYGYDEEFSRQITFLFTTLHYLETRHASAGHQKYTDLTVYLPTLALNPEIFPLQRLFVSWRIHLLSPSSLPRLECIRTLTMARPLTRASTGKTDNRDLCPSERKLDYRILLDLADRLPNLVTLRCEIGADELFVNSLSSLFGQIDNELHFICQDWVGPRRDTRSDFAKAVDTFNLTGLRHVHLDFLYPLKLEDGGVDLTDQRVPMFDLVHPKSNDSLSSSLRVLSYGLRTMHLRGIFDATLFWPTESVAPQWPSLEHLHVVFHGTTPSGSWYFTSIPGLEDIGGTDEGVRLAEDKLYPPLVDTEMDHWVWDGTSDIIVERHRFLYKYRTEPNAKTMTPFLADFAKAVKQMQHLKTFALWSPLGYELQETYEHQWDISDVADGTRDELMFVRLAWGIAYTSPGSTMFGEDSEQTTSDGRHLWWRTGEWRPPTDLHQAFQEIGFARDKNAMLEHFEQSKLRYQGRKDFEAAASRLSTLQ